ncbi:hypothetical protein [Streptomyces sp. NPDC002785]|uniref:hypothetical protein n=1 Tax=Streptomyces sp. NPDC002785 TaxID=3154543 RepID=UPI00332E93BB
MRRSRIATPAGPGTTKDAVNSRKTTHHTTPSHQAGHLPPSPTSSSHQGHPFGPRTPVPTPANPPTGLAPAHHNSLQCSKPAAAHNPHTYEGTQYLVSARGHSQWVRNMRVAGGGELRVGRRIRTFTAVEIADDEQKLIVRAYLEQWGWEVNQYFQGITAKSTDTELLAACPDHPVFRITVEG